MRYSHHYILWWLLVLYACLTTCVAAIDAQETEQQEKRTLPGERCQVSARDKWTEQEKWVWTQVCEGNVADFNTADGYGGKLDPQKPEGWPKNRNRVLQPAFLETVLLHEPWRSAVPRQGVRIKGAWFKDELDLSNAELTHELRLDNSRFDSMVSLFRLRTSHVISFDGSTVTGPLTMGSLHVGSSLFMRRGATFAEVNLLGAQIEGQLSMTQATVTGPLTMASLHVGSALLLRRGTFAEVDLRSAQIEGQLSMIQSTVTGPLTMDSLHVGSDLFMRGGTFAEVNLLGAQIEGQLSMTQATVTGPLTMDSLHVGSSLFMRGATFAKVDLRGAQIEGQLSMIQATVTGPLTMDSLHVGSDLFMRGGTFIKAPSINIIFATIGNNLELTGSRDLPSLNLTGTTIDGELVLARDSSASTWQQGGQLTLRNTKAGALQEAIEVKPNTSKADAMKAWPDTLELSGFTYGRVGGFMTQGEAEMAARPVSWFKVWLEKQPHYAPQPYEQLAKVLREAGYKDKATAILYASKRREHKETTRWWQSAWWGLTLQRLFIGYGYYNFRVLWSVLIFCAIGTVVLHLSGQGPKGWMHQVLYSFDMLFPLIEIHKPYHEKPLDGGYQWYFCVHKIVGYLLTLFFVAGLAGLTKQ